MESIKSDLIFQNYEVEKIEFYNNLNFDSKNNINIDFDIDSNINFSDDNSGFLLRLSVKVFKDAIKNNYPFSMNLSVIGMFKLDTSNKEKISTFAEVNGVAILFPYVRAIISTYTANANVPPLILPPVNVINYLKSKKKNQKKDK
ncbi:protein-export chaperone SecB [Clostridium tyrobutyricum]|jgi:preprotein translocase subunit SecB|uniref:protein-export chaperone SecB n=1 Tax=Clostridium tyrobutyricum TaxID=1519 RepID=UPI0011CAD7D7|nr:protein-export chaperone SecB [Clostridium tyrobutyricum]MBV4432701.1 protein-export chaperone SecB [Clostridium tyrobutyricum]